MLPANPTVPSVGAAGLLGSEDAHCRGGPNPSRPYSKNASIPTVRIWRSVPQGWKCSHKELVVLCTTLIIYWSSHSTLFHKMWLRFIFLAEIFDIFPLKGFLQRPASVHSPLNPWLWQAIHPCQRRTWWYWVCHAEGLPISAYILYRFRCDKKIWKKNRDLVDMKEFSNVMPR